PPTPAPATTRTTIARRINIFLRPQRPSAKSELSPQCGHFVAKDTAPGVKSSRTKGRALRKLAAAILIGLLFAVGAGTGSGLAQGVVTFKVTNKSPYIIMMKMFSQTRSGWVWPSQTTHFTLNDSTERAARLACEVGEKVCFGASYSPDDTPR